MLDQAIQLVTCGTLETSLHIHRLINATGSKNSVADNVPVINDNNVSSDNDQTNTTQNSDMFKYKKHSKK